MLLRYFEWSWMKLVTKNPKHDEHQGISGTYLFPRHGHILQQLVDCMGNKLQGPQVDTFVMAKFARRHVSMILE
jgi:hypothetical protein